MTAMPGGRASRASRRSAGRGEAQPAPARRASRPSIRSARELGAAPRRARCSTPGHRARRCAASSGRPSAHSTGAAAARCFIAAADLLGSTSIIGGGEGLPAGLLQRAGQPRARARSRWAASARTPLSGVLSGIVGVRAPHRRRGSSYGAFLAPLGHIARAAARHRQPGAARAVCGRPSKPMILICAPRGAEDRRGRPDARRPAAAAAAAGELPARRDDHADAVGAERDLARCSSAALERRPAVIAPFVTRPNETGARSRGAGPRAGQRRGRRASTCCARRAARPT